MGGSGLKELLCIVYAPLSVDKMLQGHAYARAIRGHFMATTVLFNTILDQVQITEEEKSTVKKIVAGFLDESPAINTSNDNPIIKSWPRNLEPNWKNSKPMDPQLGCGSSISRWFISSKSIYMQKDLVIGMRT
ncbi:unnamed protein product [Euphydryas editha]|uniref:Uncharacterized protein n=1 Tax=Euphydryas editha TaxID=104508 RepID=A0AAU9VAZ8_EUPED|nr:unnamed protein product [Euphydryas editha]